MSESAPSITPLTIDDFTSLFGAGNGTDSSLPTFVVSIAEGDASEGTVPTLCRCPAGWMTVPMIETFMCTMTSETLGAFLTAGLVSSYGIDEIPPMFNISLTNIPADVLSGRLCTHVKEFYDLVRIVSSACGNIREVCNTEKSIMWLAAMAMVNKSRWTACEPLLQCGDSAILSLPMMGETRVGNAPNNQAVYGYPQLDAAQLTTMYKYSNFTARANGVRDYAMDEDSWVDLLRILSACGCIGTAREIIKAYVASVDNYAELLRGKIITVMREIDENFFTEAFWYASRVMFREELSMYRKRSVVSPRFIMSSDDAACLPRAGFGSAAASVYAPYKKHTSQKTFDLPNRFDGERGIYSTGEIADRIDEFTQGILRGMDWSGPGYKVALTGSTITACAIINPLEECCPSKNAYWEEYYPSEGAEIVAPKDESAVPATSTDFSSDDEFNASFVVKRAMVVQPESRPHRNTLPRRKSRPAAPTADDSLRSRLRHDPIGDPTDVVAPVLGVGTSDIDLMIECTKSDFREVCARVYEQIKSTSAEFCMHAGIELDLERVDTENFYKYSITGLRRPIELFHVDSIPLVIAKYHLAPVRAWWDGSMLWCFPTFVQAAYSGISADIRWTSNRKDVSDIVLKYFQRGFGVALCKDDNDKVIARIAQCPDTWGVSDDANPRQRGWRWRYRNARSAYYENSLGIFNPSKSRLGIYSEIDRGNACYVLPKLIKEGRYQRPAVKLPTGYLRVMPHHNPKL